MNFSLGVGIFKSLSCLLFSGTPSVPQKEWLSPLYLLFLHVLSGLVRPFCFIHQENPTCLQSAKKFFKISGLIPNHPLPHLLQIYSCQSYNGISGKRESKRVSICHLDGSFSSLSMCSSPDCLYRRMPRSLLPRSACGHLYEPSLGYQRAEPFYFASFLCVPRKIAT